VAGQVFQCVKRRPRLADALAKNFNSGFGSDAYVAGFKIYSACHLLQARCVLDPFTVFSELSISPLEFIAKLRRLLGIPLRVLGPARTAQAKIPTLAFLGSFGPRCKSCREHGGFQGRRWSKPTPGWLLCSPRAADGPHAREWLLQ